VFGGEHRIFITVKNAIAGFLRAIAALDQLFVLTLKLFQLGWKCGWIHLAWAMVVAIKLVVGSKFYIERNHPPTRNLRNLALSPTPSPRPSGERAGARGFSLE
jgi:hypothetical protein